VTEASEEWGACCLCVRFSSTIVAAPFGWRQQSVSVFVLVAKLLQFLDRPSVSVFVHLNLTVSVNVFVGK
jgi:hypothetical protein